MEEYYEYLLKERESRIRWLIAICGVAILGGVIVLFLIWYFNLLPLNPRVAFFGAIVASGIITFSGMVLYQEFAFRQKTEFAYRMNIKKDEGVDKNGT